MKKTILFITLNLLSVGLTFSQSFEWGINIGQWTNDYPIDIDKTSDGVLITTTANGYETKGLYRYDSEGNEIWKFDFFDDFDNYGFLASAVDKNNNIYTLLSRPGEYGGFTTVNGINIYNGISLLKINSQGNVEWDIKIGGQASGVNILYKNDFLYILGQFYGEISIKDEITLNSQQYWDCFSWIYRTGEDFYVAKFNIDGNLVDAKNFGEDYPDYVTSVTIDNNENIYLTGGSDFHSCTTRYTHITKVNSNLDIEWKKEISKEENSSQLIYPSNIYYSQNGKIYLWGYNRLSIIHPDYTIPESTCSDLSTNQGFSSNLLEFNATTGNFLKYKSYTTCTINPIWQVSGTVSTTLMNKGSMIDLNDNELIVFTSFNRPIEFNNGLYEPTHQISQYDEFFYEENLLLFKVDKQTLDSDYIVSFSGELSNQYAEKSKDNPGPILLDDNSLYITASFQENPIYIFNGTINNNSGNNNSDVLVSKIDLQNVLSIHDHYRLTTLSTYPNPVKNELNYSTKNEIKNIKIYSTEGKLVMNYLPIGNNNKIDLSNLKKGVYFGHFFSKNNTMSIKKIIKE